MQANIDRLADHARSLNVNLRPHLKTVKSVDIAKRVLTGENGPATVSTLAEAETFAKAEVRDILYAVGITEQKLPRIAKLCAMGCSVSVLLDSVEQAYAVARFCKKTNLIIPAFIEIDSDGHRGGITVNDPELLTIGRILENAGILRGVLAHAGESYNMEGREAHAACAEQERATTVAAASILRNANLPCPVVSIGSTPTAFAARDLTGITELRAGVYVFFDLVMAGIGVCIQEDIALSVLTTVIGVQPQQGRILIDAGWMALSRDRGTADQRIDQGYGVACDANGAIYPELIVSTTNQEHGIITAREGATVPDVPIGTQLRILPNHSCATAAQHTHYNVIPSDAEAPLLIWHRFGGW
ncbi:alanine racemase [Cochlodiniinecator piscidefendens]|uniref:alanine racemase n=1 Tax=Cochlodiniinecator piscidefendens TaxID=2715756 RepID=UPI001E4C0956|nr:alanine racemase [Cochlodiniinecator piscidefendens]